MPEQTTTPSRSAYRQRPEVKARIKAYKNQYHQRPDVQAKRRAYARKYAAEHKEEIRQKRKDRRATEEFKIAKRHYRRVTKYKWRPTKEQIRASKLKVKAQREAEYAANAGRTRSDACDICAKATGRIVYDHCHKHGHFRGFLCDRCNLVLGAIKDDTSLLLKMIAYLKRPPRPPRQFALPGI